MKLLADLDLEEIKNILPLEPAFRTAQLFKWISLGADYSSMTNLPNSLKESLKKEFLDNALQIIHKIDSPDKSTKLLYKLNDSNIIEGVFMRHSYGNTLCVSTQVGCRMSCKFCASSIGGLKRNLSCGEIYSQVIAVNKQLGTVNNIVLMGSGEPLDNYDNVVKFIRLINSEKGLNIGQRSITLSTCGLADKILKLADENFSINLSISLHATQDETRAELIPMARKFSIKEIMDASKYYFEKTGRRVSLEYIMIKGVNMSFFDAKRLKELTKNMPIHINLIMLNNVEESSLKPCTNVEAERFLKRLTDLKLNATIRRSAGQKTNSGCGQLRRNYLKSDQISDNQLDN